MPSLGACEKCGGNLAVIGGMVACGECSLPAPNHPMMQRVGPARLAEADQKLAEIDGQMVVLKAQRERWIKVRDEELQRQGIAAGTARRPVPHKAPSLPSMVPPGGQIVAMPAHSLTQHPPVSAAKADGDFCDTSKEPLLAKASNAAGQSVIDKGKRR